VAILDSDRNLTRSCINRVAGSFRQSHHLGYSARLARDVVACATRSCLVRVARRAMDVDSSSMASKPRCPYIWRLVARVLRLASGLARRTRTDIVIA